MISLARQEDVGNDGHDDDDGDFGMPPAIVTVIADVCKIDSYALRVTAVTVVTAVLGYPLPTAATVTLTPCMTVMSMMTVFLGYPPRKSRHRHAAILLSEAVRRRIAGHSPALRESRGNVWHTTLQGKV